MLSDTGYGSGMRLKRICDRFQNWYKFHTPTETDILTDALKMLG